MNAYEQVRTLKEIAAELKGIRHDLDIIVSIFKTNDLQIVRQNEEQEDNSEAFFCSWKKEKCTRCVSGNCPFRVKVGAGNG